MCIRDRLLAAWFVLRKERYAADQAIAKVTFHIWTCLLYTSLLSAVWGFDSDVETRVTDETLRRLRNKLLQAGSTVIVSTIWGFGYKLMGAERRRKTSSCGSCT